MHFATDIEKRWRILMSSHDTPATPCGTPTTPFGHLRRAPSKVTTAFQRHWKRLGITNWVRRHCHSVQFGDVNYDDTGPYSTDVSRMSERTRSDILYGSFNMHSLCSCNAADSRWLTPTCGYNKTRRRAHLFHGMCTASCILQHRQFHGECMLPSVGIL